MHLKYFCQLEAIENVQEISVTIVHTGVYNHTVRALPAWKIGPAKFQCCLILFSYLVHIMSIP